MKRSVAIAALAATFETRKRDNGEEFVVLKDGRPEWMRDVCREAHGGMMPDDTRYAMIREVVDAINNGGDDACEIADTLCDTYNTALVEWLASSPIKRAEYVDEANEERGVRDDDGLFGMLRRGQYMEYCEIASAILDYDYDSIEDSIDGIEVFELDADDFPRWSR